MAAASEKIQAISRLAFPITLQDLQHYLGLTGWMRDYVPYYAQIMKLLQLRKTEMLQGLAKSGTSGKQRKQAARSTRLVEPIDKERASFDCLQGILSKGGFLHYFDSSRRLYIDLDSLKRGVGVIVYHVKGDPDPEKATNICKTDIQPIMFLSKLLSTAESHYWPTELEMAGLVWAIKKLRHLIDSTAKPVIVYTDHSAITSIARQTTLLSSNTDKLNNRLIQASQYLAQFNINVRYKPGKHHLVPDALSRLPVEGSKTDQTSNILDGLTEVEALLVTAIELIFLENDDFDRAAFNVTLVELANEFKDRLKQAYLDDKRWSEIRKSAAEAEKSPSMAFPDFRLRNNLLYLIDHDKRERLVILQNLEKEVFELSHDLSHHQGFHRAFDQLTTSMYFDRNAAKHFCAYIEHCPTCQLNQTKRHKPYGELQPIQSALVSFNTIAMDFVMALPEEKYHGDTVDALLNITEKYTK